jgi:hypothetical protein
MKSLPAISIQIVPKIDHEIARVISPLFKYNGNSCEIFRDIAIYSFIYFAEQLPTFTDSYATAPPIPESGFIKKRQIDFWQAGGKVAAAGSQ